MIPKIKRYNGCYSDNGYYKWQVCSQNGIDITSTLSRAIRYWLWHCGVPSRIAFWSIHPQRLPEYYKLVTIEYIDHIMGELVTANAWLAVDDDGHYIWTLDDNITVIDDDDVLD